MTEIETNMTEELKTLYTLRQVVNTKVFRVKESKTLGKYDSLRKLKDDLEDLGLSSTGLARLLFDKELYIESKQGRYFTLVIDQVTFSVKEITEADKEELREEFKDNVVPWGL